MPTKKTTPVTKSKTVKTSPSIDDETVVVKRVARTPVAKKLTAEDKGETINVKVGAPAEKVVVTKTPKIVPAPEPEDIPDELLPTAGELDLHEDFTSSKKADEVEDMWAAELIDEKSEKEATEDPLTDKDTKSQTTVVPPKVVTPEPDNGAEVADDGKLLGFIHQHSKPGQQESSATHPAGETARAQLAKPKIFDTEVLHLPVDPSVTKSGKSKGVIRVLFALAVLLALVAVVYLSIDAGWLGDGIKVPFEIIK
jgi:hypothetical protein